MTETLSRPAGTRRYPATGEHPIAALLHRAARREFPPPDDTVEVCPAPTGPSDAVLAFPGYSMVAADVPQDWVRGRTGRGGALSPRFLTALADRLGVAAPEVHVLLAARKPPQAGARAGLRRSDRVPPEWAEHRTDVTCHADVDGSGVIALGRGPGRRLDLYVELEGAERPWLRACTLVEGRELLEAARTLATGDLFASVPAHDGAALRTYLCGGFRAIGAEALFLTRPRHTPTWFPS